MSQEGVPRGPRREAAAPLGGPHVEVRRAAAALSGKALPCAQHCQMDPPSLHTTTAAPCCVSC